MKLHAIEGNAIKMDGGALFGNAPKALWQRWFAADEQNRIALSARALLIQTDAGQNILIETGVGAFFDPKLKERFGIPVTGHLLIDNLRKHGLEERDIDSIVLTHLHFDHAGGLLSPYGEGPMRLLFPRARYYVGKQHWQRALKPHLRERASFIPDLHHLLEQSGRLVLVDQAEHPDLKGISFIFSQGHTVGLMLPVIDTSDGPVFFASDLVPGVAWFNRAISMGYDRYAELVLDEKAAFLDTVKDRQGRIFFTHDPEVAWGNPPGN
jgi:glyoxylase-like metal-dependent hydrolase (beta-lactamase superfamily II)